MRHNAVLFVDLQHGIVMSGAQNSLLQPGFSFSTVNIHTSKELVYPATMQTRMKLELGYFRKKT